MTEILATISIGFFIICAISCIVSGILITVPAIKNLTRYNIRDGVVTVVVFVGFIGVCYLAGSFV